MSFTPVAGRRSTKGSGTGGRPVHVGSDSGLPPVQVPADDSEAEKKRYWRELYQRQVDIIQQLRGEIEILDTAIPGLWNKFYAWDDPAYRDSVIKPELDQALLRREHLEKQLVEERARGLPGGLAGVGAVLALSILGRIHDRQLQKIVA